MAQTLVFKQALSGSYTIPSSVTNVGGYAFFVCDGLTSVSIGSNVTSIGDSAFYACASLTDVTIPASVTSIGNNAFLGCAALTNVTINGSVTSIGNDAFEVCGNLRSVYFKGNAPNIGSDVFIDNLNPPADDTNVSIYYLPGTTGWSSPFASVPALMWNPLIQASGASFGISNNQFGFNITGTNNFTVVVEACTNLANSAWIPLRTVTLTNGSFYFSEPLQTNSPGRFYGLGLP